MKRTLKKEFKKNEENIIPKIERKKIYQINKRYKDGKLSVEDLYDSSNNIHLI